MNFGYSSTFLSLDKGLIERCDFRYSRISSFNNEILWKVQKLRPKIPVGALFNKGLSRSESGPKKTFREATPCEFVKNLRPDMDSANLCAETVTKEEIECAHNAKVKVLLAITVKLLISLKISFSAFISNTIDMFMR